MFEELRESVKIPIIDFFNIFVVRFILVYLAYFLFFHLWHLLFDKIHINRTRLQRVYDPIRSTGDSIPTVALIKTFLLCLYFPPPRLTYR